jgi:hypothetical protein
MFESIVEDFMDDDIQFRSFISVEVIDDHTVQVKYDVQNLADLEYTIRLSGPDADDFEFVQIGANADARLQSVAPLDYENPDDGGPNSIPDNIYEFTTTRSLDAPGYILVDTTDTYTLHVLDVGGI